MNVVHCKTDFVYVPTSSDLALFTSGFLVCWVIPSKSPTLQKQQTQFLEEMGPDKVDATQNPEDGTCTSVFNSVHLEWLECIEQIFQSCSVLDQ